MNNGRQRCLYIPDFIARAATDDLGKGRGILGPLSWIGYPLLCVWRPADGDHEGALRDPFGRLAPHFEQGQHKVIYASQGHLVKDNVEVGEPYIDALISVHEQGRVLGDAVPPDLHHVTVAHMLAGGEEEEVSNFRRKKKKQQTRKIKLGEELKQ